MVVRAFAAEFPNDNPELHAGTIWMSTEPCGRPEPHFAAAPDVEPERVTDTGPAPESEPEETSEPIEIVESIELEGPVEVVPSPDSPIGPPVVLAALIESAVEPSLSVEFTEPEAPGEALAEEPGDDDPYALFIRKLAEVAVASGATMDAVSIDTLLGTDAVATAWRAILRGESEDFSTCGGALDEWAATALASMMSAPHKIAQIRRELRARGVAAFGLIDAG